MATKVSFTSFGPIRNSVSHPTSPDTTRSNETGVIVVLMDGGSLVSRTTSNSTDSNGVLNDIAVTGVSAGTVLECFIRLSNGDGVPGFNVTVIEE